MCFNFIKRTLTDSILRSQKEFVLVAKDLITVHADLILFAIALDHLLSCLLSVRPVKDTNTVLYLGKTECSV